MCYNKIAEVSLDPLAFPPCAAKIAAGVNQRCVPENAAKNASGTGQGKPRKDHRWTPPGT